MPNAFDGNGCFVRPVPPEEMHRSPYVPLRHHAEAAWRALDGRPMPPEPRDARPENLVWFLTGFMMGAVGTLLIFGVVML